eukprot:XP_011452774.2 PREDICTED: calbindin-32 isoform X2 [Crassostrea gigas]
MTVDICQKSCKVVKKLIQEIFSTMATSAEDKSSNFLRQFRDLKTREFKLLSAQQFMEVWNHYDTDGNGFIEGSELDSFLTQLVTSINSQDIGPERLDLGSYATVRRKLGCNKKSSHLPQHSVVSPTALMDAKTLLMNAFDENSDGKIDIAELAQILPTEETFLLLFRRDNPLESSVEFMKVWREFDKDRSGYIEADELKNFLLHLLKQSKRDNDVSEEQLITYTDTVLQLFDRNKDGKLQLSEMAKLLPVKENFLCRPVFKSASKLTKDDIDKVFRLYDRDNSHYIENEELNGFLKDLMDLVEEDYDEADLIQCREALLRDCDQNHDGKIDYNELRMLLMSYNQVSIDNPGFEQEDSS